MKKFEVAPRDGVTRPIVEGRTAGFPYPYLNDFAVSYTPIRSGIWNIYLFGVIEDANQFIGAIEVLQAAGENDVVCIHLSTDGGSLDATDTFINAMRDCEARIIVKASGGVHSAGTVILMHADEFILSENFNCLIHNGSTGSGGKFSDWKLQVQHTQRYMEKVMRNTYEGFLSEDELVRLLEGVDIWLDAEGFVKRWEARQLLLRGRAEEAQERVLAELIARTEEVLEEEEVKPKAKPRKRKPAAK